MPLSKRRNAVSPRNGCADVPASLAETIRTPGVFSGDAGAPAQRFPGLTVGSPLAPHPVSRGPSGRRNGHPARRHAGRDTIRPVTLTLGGVGEKAVPNVKHAERTHSGRHILVVVSYSGNRRATKYGSLSSGGIDGSGSMRSQFTSSPQGGRGRLA